MDDWKALPQSVAKPFWFFWCWDPNVTESLHKIRGYWFLDSPGNQQPWYWRCAMRIMMTSSNGNIFRVTGPFCGEFTGPGEFPAQRPVTRSFDVFYFPLNKRLSTQWWGWWFETPSRSLWRHCNDMFVFRGSKIKKLELTLGIKYQLQCAAFQIKLIGTAEETAIECVKGA